MFHVLKCNCSIDFHFELVFDDLLKYWKIGLPAYRSGPSNLFLNPYDPTYDPNVSVIKFLAT